MPGPGRDVVPGNMHRGQAAVVTRPYAARSKTVCRCRRWPSPPSDTDLHLHPRAEWLVRSLSTVGFRSRRDPFTLAAGDQGRL